jgi:hypothetical protein
LGFGFAKPSFESSDMGSLSKRQDRIAFRIAVVLHVAWFGAILLYLLLS